MLPLHNSPIFSAVFLTAFTLYTHFLHLSTTFCKFFEKIFYFIFKRFFAPIKAFSLAKTRRMCYTVDTVYNEVIQNKKSRFIQELETSKAIHLVLISASDVNKNEYSEEFQKIILSDSLFR